MALGTCSQPPPLIDQVRVLGALKVATRNSPTAYYLGVDGPEGPEYELAAGFARRLGVALDLRVVPSATAAIDEVRRNRAHVAAAGIVATEARRESMRFGPVYQRISQHVIHAARKRQPASAADLVGMRIEVLAGSTHAAALAALAAQYPGIAFTEVAGVDQFELLDRVSNGTIDATIANSTDFWVGRHLHPELRQGFEIATAQEVAWALSPRDRSLDAEVAAYFAELEAQGRLAAILDHYFAEAEDFDYLDSVNFLRHVNERLPALRPYFEEAAARTGLDWRLIAAVGYQESKWDPKAVSPTGVRGLMMLTSDTARRVGVTEREDARQSILGGARYLVEVRAKIPERIPDPDRMWLALAGYNVGFGHLEDARILTQRHGRNPDAWEDVRAHLPLLAQERWHTETRLGYARGWEPVHFVDNVRGYLNMLVWMTGSPDGELRLQPPATDG
jgi:membrane-bound lytic murein transglycosylase F